VNKIKFVFLKTNKILSQTDSEEEGKKPQINKIQFSKVDIKNTNETRKVFWNALKTYTQSRKS
jgi:hypothetical protein